MRKQILSSALLAGAAALTLSACATDGDMDMNMDRDDGMSASASTSASASAGAPVMIGGAAMLPTNTIVQNAMLSNDHTTLVKAVQAAGLVDTLSGPGPFTVFAPTDAAFARIPAETLKPAHDARDEGSAERHSDLPCRARNYDGGRFDGGDPVGRRLRDVAHRRRWRSDSDARRRQCKVDRRAWRRLVCDNRECTRLERHRA